MDEFWKTTKPEFANPMMLPHVLYPISADALDIDRYREMRKFLAETIGFKELRPDGTERFGDIWVSNVHTRSFAFRHEKHRMLLYMAFAEG